MSLLAKITVKVRYSLCFYLVRKLTPKFYSAYVQGYNGGSRPMTLFVKQKMGQRKLLGCEIGVAEGENARNMLETLNVEKLFLIDPYLETYMEQTTNGEHLANVSTSAYVEAQNNVRAFKDKVVFLVKTSDEAVEDVPNGLDFVYIDGNHSYEYVKRDLENYYPKVKSGGVVGGHDFSLVFFEGLVRAVAEFAFKHDLKIYGRGSDWWMVVK
jgi:hypothetical protein